MCIFENTLNSLIKVLFLLSPTQCLKIDEKSHRKHSLKLDLNPRTTNFEIEGPGFESECVQYI